MISTTGKDFEGQEATGAQKFSLITPRQKGQSEPSLDIKGRAGLLIRLLASYVGQMLVAFANTI